MKKKTVKTFQSYYLLKSLFNIYYANTVNKLYLKQN